MDGRVRVARLAHDRHAGAAISSSRRRLASGSARRLSRVPAAGGTQRIDAPTPYVWIIGRTKTDGPPDYDAVHKIQAGYKITPLSDWGKTPKPVEVKIDPSVDMKTPPKVQVDTMPAGKYFAYAAELLKLHPPHLTDEPIIAQMKRIGIEPGKSFDFDKARPRREEGARSGAGGGAEADGMEGADARPRRERLVDEHRHDGRLRQLLSQARHRRPAGLGANLPEDAIYPLNLGDEAGRPLDGANNTRSTSTRAPRRR